MILKKTSARIIFYYLILFFLVWIVLFEFIFPVNNFLPKPLIVLASFGSLWEDYHLPINILSSVASIYLSIIAAYYLLKLLNKFLLNRLNGANNFISSIEWMLKYIPIIIAGFFLIYWFPNTEFVKYIFIFIVVLNSLLIKHFNLTLRINQDYVDSAVSLGASKSAVADKIIWKTFQPDLINHICNSHLYFWTMILIFEYVKYGFGLGVIFRRALEFKDLSVLFSVTLISGIIIFLGEMAIQSTKKKFFFWNGIEY